MCYKYESRTADLCYEMGLVCAPIDYPAGITEVWLFIEASAAVEDQTRAAVH